jgi:glycosyltransferase involved in cell wall biosynthesis
MDLHDITPLVLTFNEGPNLRRTLERLAWARQILVIDSFSTDDTLEIARAFPQVRIVQRAFDSFAGQCNFGLAQIQTEWVLSLDADYLLTEELTAELRSIEPPPGLAGFRARFRYCIAGHPLRASLYPPRTVLYRRDRAQYHNDGHGHRVAINGDVGTLSGLILHDDRKPLSRWLVSQDKYAALEVKKLFAAPAGSLRLQDRLRLWMIPAPLVVLLYTLLWKRLIFDGWPGWLYVFQRVTAELVLSMHLIEARISQWKADRK